MRTNRLALLCGLAGALALCLPAAPAGAVVTRDVLFVGNSSDGTVDVIDAATFAPIEVINAIADGSTPQDPVQAAVYGPLVGKVGINYIQDIALSLDGRTLYVSRGYLGDVVAIDLASRSQLWRLQSHSLRADHLELSPDGRRLFLSALTSDLVEVIDVASHSFTGEIPAGDWPHTLGFSPDGKTLYSGSLGVQIVDQATPETPPTDGRHWLERIDPVTMLPLGAPCELGEGIRPFTTSLDGSVLYLQLSYYNGIVSYDPVKCAELGRLALPLAGRGLTTAPHDYPNLAAQHGIAISPDGGTLCSAGTIDDYAALVSLPSFTLAATLPVGQEPAYAVNSPSGQYCFVSSRGASANSVSVISYATQSVVATIPTGLHPQVELTATVPASILG
ncbi:MAG: beta-propeller fold lactonase family protein [Candidatus Dormibacteria bacterium]